MYRVVTIAAALVSIVLGFFWPPWGWAVLALPAVALLATLWRFKQKKWAYISDLSPKANEMLKEFGHFYAAPAAGTDFSTSARAVMLGGAIIAVMGCFRGFWWGILFAVVCWIVMGRVARAFDPTNFLAGDEEGAAHEEIISFIQRKGGTRKPDG